MAKKAAKSSVTSSTSSPASASSAAAKPALSKTAVSETAVSKTAVSKTAVSKTKKHLKAQAAGVAAAVEGFVQAIVNPHETIEAQPEVTQPEITHETISIRAYILYLERKGENGSPAGDWLRAEQELRAGLVR